MPLIERKFTEKRDYIRMEVDAEITFKVQGSSREFKGLCKNLSHTGVQFEIPESLVNDSVLEATIKTKGSKFQPLKVTLAVLRVDRISADRYLVSGEMIKIDGIDINKA